MRPHRLVLRSFRSYRDEVAFDFGGRSLVGVVGPIGSGKSTILDAVAFALYGQTPTIGKQTKSLINQRHDASHVELWFAVDGEMWRAVRALRRKGQSAHTLSRHDELDGERLELVEGEKAVNARVAELLGLDFHAFGRSVLLAQNQFARFLDATGGERDAVLKGVFGLDRVEAIRELAKRQRDEAWRDLEELQRRRTEIEADRVALEAATKELEPLREVAEAFAAAVPVVEGIEGAIAGAARQAEAAKATASSVAELASRLPSRTTTAALLAASEADAETLSAAAAASTAATATLAGARERRDAVVAETGDREALARLEASASRAADLGRAVAEAEQVSTAAATSVTDATTAVTATEEAEAKARRAADAATADAEEARRVVAAAEESLHEARHAEMAAALRSELHAGDRCPVCGQDVGELEVGRSAGLDDAEAAVVAAKASATTADATLKVANDDLTAATAAAAAAKARRDEATATAAVRSRELEEARAHHAAASKAVVDTLGAGDPLQILAKRRRRLDDADSDAAKAADALDRANEAKAAAEADAEKRRRAMSRLATEVAALGGSLGAEIEVEAGRESLGSALESLWELWEARSAAAEDAVKEAARLLEEAIGDRSDLHRDLGVDGDFATARSEAAAAAAAAANKVELLTERVGRVEALEKENEATLVRHGVYARIADDLAPSKFLAYLLDEERVILAELAAERFEMLSGGRYRFSEDGTFDVLDLAAAEAVRKPRSLSGGETFLASLALALALAEMVSRSGGRLEAFFLDEGFGSLDPEHLDLAMEGIERIVADDRLVLVVSHVAELRHRLEDLIELSKHPVTGDTVVVRA